MKRRAFIKNSSLSAIAVSAFGTIHWNGKSFAANTATTTDILGPFYRPGCPLRNDLTIAGSKGSPLTLSGTVFKEDGKTPLKDALIEIWHCDENQVYDNETDSYNYRGALKTGMDGKYSFNTILPVPYKANPADESSWRPAHIHLRISSEAQQDLITQIYFKGDQYLDVDSSSAHPASKQRILPITNGTNQQKQVTFDVVMSKTFSLDDTAFTKIEGLYRTDNKIENSESIYEFIRKDDLLFVKLKGQLVGSFQYAGNNTFEEAFGEFKVKFEFPATGQTKAIIDMYGTKVVAEKFLKYKGF